jgi:hypothetical protein
MRVSRVVLGAWLLSALILLALEGSAQSKRRQELQEQEPEAVRLVVARMITRENELTRTLQDYRPRIETYLQGYRPDSELGAVPVNDYYFLGRLVFDEDTGTRSFLRKSSLGGVPRFFGGIIKRPFRFQYEMDSFAEAALVDGQGFNREHYEFQFVRSEFLGDVRCLVFDVLPGRHAGTGRFKGRIWVEDRDYTIVRFKGVRVNPPKLHLYFHFDSWRQNLQPGFWLPVYVYAEESDLNPRSWPRWKSKPLRFRSQTRFWGYDLSNVRHEQELTRILVDAPVPVRDSSETATDPSPLASQREWQNEAENNVLERLEKARLIAPAGEVDKVLQTVVDNLIVTNRLDNLPAVHCRVMLTLPFESFTLGNTIVLSRGLIDVLPDEATLAMALAHELGHLVLGHTTDTKYAFYDRLQISDEELLGTLDFSRDAREETAADLKGIELLRNSPYKDSLRNVGLFLRAMAQQAPDLRRLFGAHLGNRLADGNHMLRMAEMMSGAPQLQSERVDQVAALPLGSRLKVDAWSGQVELAKTKLIAPMTAREKMPFLVTPLFPYLTRKQTATASPPVPQKATAENTPALN